MKLFILLDPQQFVENQHFFNRRVTQEKFRWCSKNKIEYFGSVEKLESTVSDLPENRTVQILKLNEVVLTPNHN